MAYTTGGTANFNFFINRQGPRGPQGVQGPEGFSPNVEVAEDYGNTFTLRVTNKDSSFVTSNLREHKEDRGGTYVRWDKTTEQMYLGDADALPVASETVLGVIKIADNDDINNKNNSTAITPKQLIENITLVKSELQADIDNNTQLINTYYQELSQADKQNVKLTGAQTITGDKTFSNKLTAKNILCEKILDSSGDNTIIGLTATGRIDIGGSNTPGIRLNTQSIPYINKDGADQGHILTQKTVIAGENIEISNFSDGIKIKSTAKGADIATTTTAGVVKPDGTTITITEDGTISSIGPGDVTAAGDNIFTGNNTFNNPVHFGSSLIADSTVFYLGKAFNDSVLYMNDQQCRLGSGKRNTVVLGHSIKNSAGKNFLVQGNVTAGSDNLVIAETTDGVQITCNAPTNAQIEALQRLINDLSTKVDNLTTRLNNLEEVIDGGVAGSIYAPEPQKLQEQVVKGISVNEKINNVSEDVQVNDNGGK